MTESERYEQYCDRWYDERKNGDHGNMAYTFHATAPGCGREVLTIGADDETQATNLAREQVADILGVRAEHVVIVLKTTMPNF